MNNDIEQVKNDFNVLPDIVEYRKMVEAHDFWWRAGDNHREADFFYQQELKLKEMAKKSPEFAEIYLEQEKKYFA